MKNFAKFAAVAALTLSISAFAGSASAAAINIATSGNPQSHPELTWTPLAGTPYGTLATLANVTSQLTFDDALLSAAHSGVYKFNLSVTNSLATGGSFGLSLGTYQEGGLNGGFTFKNALNQVILGGIITDGWLKAASGATGGNFDMNTTPPVFYSDFADVTALLLTLHDESFSFGLSGITPRIVIAGTGAPGNPQHFAPFTVNSAFGGFDGVIPEPATWGLMLVGFGGLGGMLRLNRKRQALAAA